MFSGTSFHVVQKSSWDINVFRKYIKLRYDCLCLAPKAFRKYLWNILEMSKLMLSNDLPRDRATQLRSSGAGTGSQVSHGQVRSKPSCCFGSFLWIFKFGVISAGVYRRQQKLTGWFSRKGSEWKEWGSLQKSENTWVCARPETGRASGIWGGRNKGKFRAPSSDG